MTVSIGETVVMGDDGVITDNFKPSMLGDDYADSKFFDTIPDLTSLMKSAADSKSALGKKLEDVIQRPGENATDAEKSAYQAEIRKASGAADKVEDFEFGITVEGEAHEEFTKIFKEKFLEFGFSPSVASELVELYDVTQATVQEAIQAQQDQAFKDEVAAFKKDHLGDKLVVGTRTAAKAIIAFGDDDLKTKVKEAKD
ncbi:hypothetical protein LCGC14_2605680 [marine sediment metagenome]|uniref:Uncharacterized protein n=1 Tax=marine sediment metagenome TaxID=412755 RepID=A0A0F9A7C4_9ZZZZ